jgi:hypothetical protein
MVIVATSENVENRNKLIYAILHLQALCAMYGSTVLVQGRHGWSLWLTSEHKQ